MELLFFCPVSLTKCLLILYKVIIGISKPRHQGPLLQPVGFA